MSTKRQSPAPSPATTKAPARTALQVEPKPEPRGAEMVRKIFAGVRETLEDRLTQFLKDATIEEARFMIAVMDDFSNLGGFNGRPRAVDSYDVALYSAIQRQLDQCIVVVLPRDEMLHPVEEFIKQLETKKIPSRPSGRQTEEELRDKWEGSMRSEVELFMRCAGLPSLRFLHDILARWNEIHLDPDAKKLPNTLVIATEIELDRKRAETAADEAVKAVA